MHVLVCIMNVSLPTTKETRLRITVTQSANTAIQCEVQQAKRPNKQAAAGTGGHADVGGKGTEH